jgi:hypothetical protein
MARLARPVQPPAVIDLDECSLQTLADRKALNFAMTRSPAIGVLMRVPKLGAYVLTGPSAILSAAA